MDAGLGTRESGRERWVDLGRRLWSTPYRRALAGAAPLLVLAYGFAMTNFTLAGDDWFALFPSSTLDTQHTLVAGRWLMPLVWALTGHGAFVPFFSFGVALVLLTLAGLLAAAVWHFVRPSAVFAVVTLFVVNPLFGDTLSTKPGHVSYPLGMVFATLAAWMLLRWRGTLALRIAGSTGLLVLALASYQPIALAFVVVVVGWEVVRVVSEGSRYWRAAWRRWLEVLAVGVAAVALYILSVYVAWWATGTDPRSAESLYSLTGGYPSTMHEILASLRYGVRQTGRFWLQAGSLYPVALKVVDLTLVAAGVAAAVAMAGRASGGRRRNVLWVRAWLLSLGLGSLVIPFTVLFLRENPPLRGSVFTTVGLVVGLWAGLLLEGVAAGTVGGWRRWVGMPGLALVLVAVLGCAHQINQGYFGLHLGNQRDLASVNRMLSVMEQMPEFGKGPDVRVELVGRVRFHVSGEPFSDPMPGVPGLSIVHCSGLACQNHLVSMLNLIGGGQRAFVVRPVSSDPAVRAAIDSMPSWPKPGSIRFLEGTFVVKGS